MNIQKKQSNYLTIDKKWLPTHHPTESVPRELMVPSKFTIRPFTPYPFNTSLIYPFYDEFLGVWCKVCKWALRGKVPEINQVTWHLVYVDEIMISTLRMEQKSLVNSLSKSLQKVGMNPLYDWVFETWKIAETTFGDCTSQSGYQPKLGMGLVALDTGVTLKRSSSENQVHGK